MHTNEIFGRRCRVIGQDYIGKNPDKIVNAGKLSNMHIAVQTHIISNVTIALNIRQSSDADFIPYFCFFPHRHMMSGLESFSNHRTTIQNRITAESALCGQLSADD